MKIRRSFDSRASYIVASLGLLFVMLASAAFPAFASAAGSVDDRSIALSSSASGASGVSYNLTFTPENDITSSGSVVVEFCDNNSLVGLACDDNNTSDVNVNGASLGAVKYNSVTATDAGSISTTTDSTATGTSPVKNVIVWKAGADVSGAGQPISITFDSLTNPTVSGESSTVYARITTYGSDVTTAWTGGTPTASGTSPGAYLDEGGVALGIVSALGVTAYVEESMTFCVTGAVSDSSGGPTPAAGTDDEDCGNTTDPSMTLGEAISGGGSALDSQHVSTHTDYAELSTNAAHGAIVNLKSVTNDNCGGLERIGASTCDIAPQTATSGSAPLIANGSALFGVEVGSPATVGGAGNTTSSGTLAPSGSYSGSNYFMDYSSGSPTTAGITSPYGSALFGTGGDTVNNKYVPLTFGASVSNTTPAGTYTATLNMIASGTF